MDDTSVIKIIEGTDGWEFPAGVGIYRRRGFRIKSYTQAWSTSSRYQTR